MKKDIDKKWWQSLEGYVCGDYKLVKFIGNGKIGFVYKAESTQIKEIEMAVKIVPEIKDLWKNEIIKVAKLSKISGVVHYHDFGTAQIIHDDKTQIFQYTVWDYIHPGVNLSNYIEDAKDGVRVSFLIAIIENILRVLHACINHGVPRHGDLHAGNILIGEPDKGDLDASLEPRYPIYVSDFGYGITGGKKQPKDDYIGLAEIANLIISKIDWDRSTPDDRHKLQSLQGLIRKLLKEQSISERTSPITILRSILDIKNTVYSSASTETVDILRAPLSEKSLMQDVGQYQVSEMLGVNWELWKRLFVNTIPARSRILSLDISTVVTGPRGCGKTMLFRRLSERLLVECGPVGDEKEELDFVGLYLNANDIADAFPMFPAKPNEKEMARLICYANICILSEILTIQIARQSKCKDVVPPKYLSIMIEFIGIRDKNIINGEDALDKIRYELEKMKWRFPAKEQIDFGAFEVFSRVQGLSFLLKQMKVCLGWLRSKPVLLFVDDYTTPRVPYSMQRVLNRIFFQRSNEFICKIATEAATTFIAEEFSGKILQDGDDYQLIDMGEESLFMDEEERLNFLNEIFSRRFALDNKVPVEGRTLEGLLGKLGMSKTEFARRLRMAKGNAPLERNSNQAGNNKRRGATNPNVLYHGSNVFSSLWSGDTRIMIQLIQELIGQVPLNTSPWISTPIQEELQDRIFRDRGGTWLEAQTRNHPTDLPKVEQELVALRKKIPSYHFTGGSYGTHLKAIIEGFVFAARQLLLGPVYLIGKREVPRMAFRVEIIDDFRVEGLAREIYRDLIRYGLFMRDARGKSVRGAMVPRLYIRRLLLPYCTLALSKRDSVQLTCDSFIKLLLLPDEFRNEFPKQGSSENGSVPTMQLSLFGEENAFDERYNDLHD